MNRFTPVVVAAVTAASSVLACGVATPAQAAGCSDVELVFARGTGEAPGLGVLGAPLQRALAALLPGRSVSAYAVDYAAAANQASAGPGATDMTEHVVATAAACPGTQFVLGGYSQGASVTDIAIGVGGALGRGSQIPASLSGRVAAVVVYGNPLGMTRGTIAGSSSVYGPKAKEFCATGDPVCGGGGNFSAHLSYRTNGDIDAGAAFAAGLITRGGGSGGGGGTTTSPEPTPTKTQPRPTRTRTWHHRPRPSRTAGSGSGWGSGPWGPFPLPSSWAGLGDAAGPVRGWSSRVSDTQWADLIALLSRRLPSALA
ncbi:MAG: cutinase family protein [Kineosporiaceae bacterium]